MLISISLKLTISLAVFFTSPFDVMFKFSPVIISPVLSRLFACMFALFEDIKTPSFVMSPVVFIFIFPPESMVPAYKLPSASRVYSSVV